MSSGRARKLLLGQSTIRSLDVELSLIPAFKTGLPKTGRLSSSRPSRGSASPPATRVSSPPSPLWSSPLDCVVVSFLPDPKDSPVPKPPFFQPDDIPTVNCVLGTFLDSISADRVCFSFRPIMNGNPGTKHELVMSLADDQGLLSAAAVGCGSQGVRAKPGCSLIALSARRCALYEVIGGQAGWTP